MFSQVQCNTVSFKQCSAVERNTGWAYSALYAHPVFLTAVQYSASQVYCSASQHSASRYNTVQYRMSIPNILQCIPPRPDKWPRPAWSDGAGSRTHTCSLIIIITTMIITISIVIWGWLTETQLPIKDNFSHRPNLLGPRFASSLPFDRLLHYLLYPILRLLEYMDYSRERWLLCWDLRGGWMIWKANWNW